MNRLRIRLKKLKENKHANNKIENTQTLDFMNFWQFQLPKRIY